MKRNVKTLFLLLLILIITSLSTLPASAVCYRGFFDLGAGAKILTGDYKNSYLCASVTTTHGVQLNKHLFAGCGLGYSVGYNAFEYYAASVEIDEHFMPIYGCVRYDLNITNKVSPFICIKLGYFAKLHDSVLCNYNYLNHVHNDYGYFTASTVPIYISPTIGIRRRISSKVGLNFGIKYQPSWTTFKKNTLIYDGYTEMDNGSIVFENAYTVTEKVTKNVAHSVMFNIGVDF